MTDEQRKKWHEEYVQWKALGIILTLAIVIGGAIYAMSVKALDLAQNNKNEIIRVDTTQIVELKNINDSLREIKGALNIK